MPIHSLLTVNAGLDYQVISKYL